VTALPKEIADIGFEEARVVRLQPGDVIVLSTSKRLTMEAVDVLRERLGELFGDHRVAILEDGLSLEVLRKERFDGGEPR